MTIEMVAILLAGMVNLTILLTVVLKAGQLLAALATLTSTVTKLEWQVDRHTEAVTRVVAQLDDLERRVAGVALLCRATGRTEA